MKKFFLFIGIIGFFILTGCDTNKKEKVNVIFDSNGGSEIATITEKSKLDFENLPIPTKEGYSFLGWFTDEELTSDVKDQKPKNYQFTLYAKWEINSYTITFNSNGGNTLDPITKAYKTSIELPTPTKEDYIFLGWCENSDLTNPLASIEMPAGNITLYAKWKDVTYTVSFDTTGGSTIENETVVVHQPAILPTPPTKTGYSLAGWYTDAALTTAYDFTTPITSELMLYAKWSINQYTISFVSDAEISVTSITTDYNKAITAPDVPIKQGYTFIGWFRDLQTETQFVFDKMPAENFTLYAKWWAGEANVSFETNGGSTIQSYPVQIGTTIQQPEVPIKSGYDFAGWYTNVNCTTPFTSWVMPVGGITLYAKWIEAEYTITFDPQGGTMSTTEITAPYLSSIEAPAAPVKEGYYFDGWYTSLDYTTLYLFDKMPKENITLYASWIDIQHGLPITYIKTKASPSNIITSGTVISLLGDQYYGFTIQDSTGQIFVNFDQSSVSIGDQVKLIGTYMIANGIPMLVNITQLEITNFITPVLPSEQFTIASINDITPNDLNNYENFINTSGILVYHEGYYYLEDGLGQRLTISHLSYMDTSIVSMDALLNKNVEMNVLLHQYDSNSKSWIVTYEFSSLQAVQQSVEDQLTFISNYISSTYFNHYYRPHDYLNIPNQDPYAWSTITYHAVGENESLFDPTTKELLEPATDSTIDFEITITIGDQSIILNKTIDIKNSLLTISQFIHSTDDSYHTIIGTIVFVSSEDQLSILQDDTGQIYLTGCDYLIGDQIKVTAKKSTYNPLVYIESGPNTNIEWLSSNNNFNNTPTSYTLEEFFNLDTTDSSIYGEYIELRGLLASDDLWGEEYRLYNEDYNLNLYIGDYNVNHMLANYTGLEVILRGYINFDDGDPIFAFYGFRDQLRIPDYTDEELVNFLQTLFVNEYSDKVFYPFEQFDLAPYHKILGGDISWSYSAQTQTLIDEETNTFKTVTESTPVQINIVIQKNQARLEFAFSTTLEPLPIYTGDNAEDYLSSTFAYVYGTVIYHNYDYTYVKNGDHIVKINGEIPAYKGDIIMVKIQTYFSEGYYNGSIDTDDFYFEVLSRYNPYQTVPRQMELDDFNDYDDTNSSFYNSYVEVSGQLTYTNGTYLLTDGQNSVEIWSCDGYVEDHLDGYVSHNISIKAYVDEYNTFDGIWALNYTGLDGELNPIVYTDEENLDFVQAYITDQYQNYDFIGGTTINLETHHPFIDSTITYEAIGDNASFIDLSSNTLASVTEITQITIKVTATVNSQSRTFNILLTVLPAESVKPRVTIEEFKQSSGELLTTRGIIISTGPGYFQIQDSTGRIYVMTDTYITDSNINKLVEVKGSLSKYMGRYQLEQTGTISYLAQNQFVPIDYPETSLTDIVKHDLFDEEQYGKDVTLIGTVIEKVDENYYTHYYLTNGYDEVLLDCYQYYSLDNYVGYEIQIKGFLYGQLENLDEQIWAVNVLISTRSPHGYTDGDKLDIIGNRIVEMYNETIYNSYSEFYLPTSDELFYNISYTYEAINDENQVIDFNTNFIWGVLTDTSFKIKLTLSIQGQYKDYYFDIYVRATTSVTLDELKGSSGLPYDDVTLLAHYFYGVGGTKYYIYDGKVFVLNENYNYPYGISVGDYVYLRGIQNVIDQVGGYGYEITMVNANQYSSDFNITSYSIELSEIYNTNLETNDLTEKYLKVFGELLYDEFMEMFYIKNGDDILYIRTMNYEERFALMSYYSNNLDRHLYNEVYLEVLFPNIKVRGDIYLVDYKSTPTSLSYPDLTPTERVMATKTYLERTIDGLSYKPNEYIDLLTFHMIYGTTITWETNSPLYDEHYLLYTDEKQAVNFTVTIAYYEDNVLIYSIEIPITIYDEPPTISTIEDTLRGYLDEEYTIKGIVEAYDTYNWWIYLRDNTGIILINNYWDGIEVGDEIIVTGYRDYQYYGNTPCLDSWDDGLLATLSHDNFIPPQTSKVMTQADFNSLDYMHPDDYSDVVTITGTLHRLTYNNYELECDGFTITIYYSITNDLNGRFVLDAHIGDELEITGYLYGLQTIYSDSNWMITFNGDPSSYQVVA